MPNYLSPGVYVEEKPAGSRPIEGVGTAIAAFVGVTEDGPVNEPTMVSNWGQYKRTFGEFVPGGFTPLSVYQYFNNGGGACYVVRIGEDGAGAQRRAAGELRSAAKSELATYRIEAREAGPAGDEITVEIIPSPAPEGDTGEGESADGSFNLVVKRSGKHEETFEGLQTRRGKQNVATVVNELSKLVLVEEVGSATVPERIPGPGEVSLSGGGADNARRLSADDFIGDSAARRGLGALEAIDNVTMVAVPDLMAAYQSGQIDLEGVKTVQTALIAHCENMGDRIAILDSPPALNAQQVREWRLEAAGYDSAYATLYWPWVKVADPATKLNVFVPPSGSVAGVWGRSDDERGVHKAPANEIVRGAIDLQLVITKAEHDTLNPEGINVIRSFPGMGIRIWGARTLSSDPAWRYLNVRRLFNFMESSILRGTQWAVFEPNDMDLWQRLRRTITSFLLLQWRNGALFGASPNEAYYVKCDAETNPPEVIDAGQVIVEIGVAPVKPAEFVVFQLAQLTLSSGE